MTADLDALTRPDLIGPRLATITGDDRWRAPRVDLIAGGKSNLTFRLSSPAGTLVLRRPPTGAILRGAHDMGREARVQKALARTGVPVPVVLLAEDADGALGVPYYVMSEVPGHVVRDHLPEGYAPDRAGRTAIGDALVEVLATLHAVDPGAVGLTGYGRPGEFMARQVRTWTRQWEATRTRSVPAVDELGRRLGAYPFREPERTTVVHGDYRLDNVILDAGDPGTVRAVLDWELSTLGDPSSDLATLLFYWVEAGETRPVLTPALTAEPGFPSRKHLVERYASVTGADLADLAAFVGFAHFRFAAIAQGVSARVAAGAMAGQDFGDLDAEVERIAVDGLDRWEE